MNVLPLLDELRIIVQNGLKYTDDPHNQRRYGRLRELVEVYYRGTNSGSLDHDRSEIPMIRPGTLLIRSLVCTPRIDGRFIPARPCDSD